MPAPSFYLVSDPSGVVTGSGYTPDGTFPPNALPCTKEQQQAAGPWSRVTNDGIVIGAGPSSLPVPLAQQVAALMAAGVAVSSAGLPSLDGVYACSATAQAGIQAQLQAIAIAGTFADGGTELVWPDMAGVHHTFPSAAAFQRFAFAMSGFIAACVQFEHGVTSEPPSAKVSIP